MAGPLVVVTGASSGVGLALGNPPTGFMWRATSSCVRQQCLVSQDPEAEADGQ